MAAIRTHGADLSIDDIAATAGVSKPVLYDEFGGKLGIADAIAVVLAEEVETQVLAILAAGGEFDLEVAVRSVVEGLVTLIDGEPELYSFLVRSIRSNDRGFLDNALVRVVHQRASVLVGMIAPGVSPERIAVLTDGVFGFVFGAVESWQATRRLDKDDLVTTLTVVIGEGFRAVAQLADS